MSADNLMLIRRCGPQRFYVSMEFASADGYSPLADAEVFDSLEAAMLRASEEWTEYGISYVDTVTHQWAGE